MAAPRPKAARPATSRPVVLIEEDSSSPPPRRKARANEPSEAREPHEGLFFTKLFTDLKTAGDLDVPITQRENLTKVGEYRNFNPSPTIILSQGAFIPRRGELVLYLSSTHLSSHHSNTESPRQTQSADAQPVWKAGFVTQLPHYLVPPSELSDITEPNPGSLAVGIELVGFRVQTMSDSKSIHIDQQLPMEYLPLGSLRPFSFYEEILRAANIPRTEWHPSIFNALRASASFSLAVPARFTGTWPDAQISYEGLFFGSELILVGDVIRVAAPLEFPASIDQQTQTHDFKVHALKVTSIVLTFEGLAPDEHGALNLISRQPSSGSRNIENDGASFVEKAPARLGDATTLQRPEAVHTRQPGRGRPRKDPSQEHRVYSLRQRINEEDEDGATEPDSAPSNRVTGENCQQIRLRLHGKLFTRSSILPDRNTENEAEDVVIAVNNTHIPPVLQASDSNWVPVDSPYKTQSAPLSHVLGRFYEDEAVMRYGLIPEPRAVQATTTTTARGEEEEASSSSDSAPSSLLALVDLGVGGIQRGREYARNHHEWLVAERESRDSKSKELWFWGNDRVDGLFGKGDETGDDVEQRLVDGWIEEERLVGFGRATGDGGIESRGEERRG